MEAGPVVAALRRVLAAGDAPQHRIDLAARAVDALLGRAVTVRPDGTVFVSTGDIQAMWLRDSAAQVRPLLALRHEAPEVVDLVAGVLRLQVELVLADPRANAFRLDGGVFERKYEIDSLCAPLQLAWLLRQATGSTLHLDDRFVAAARVILDIWTRGQDHDRSSYRFRRFGRRRGTLSHRGHGAPFGPTGMTWSAFRPSDDRCRFPYNVPANAFVAVSLERLAELHVGFASEAQELADELRSGIAYHGTVEDAELGTIYAYEVDGLGNALLQDDANVPSLLSLPYLGFCSAESEVYRATRAFVLGPRNPWWTRGDAVEGIGSEHTRRGRVWPLAIAMEGLTALDVGERERALARIEATVTGNLLVHEAVDANDPRRFTRAWFSWADLLYVELVLETCGVP